MLGPLLVLALCAPSAAPVHAPADERRSLEELLAEFRARSEARLEALRGRVSALLERLELAIDEGGADAVAEVGQNLLDLCPEAAPLLVRAIDPGANAGDETVRRRALEVSRVLAARNSAAITDELLALLERGTTLGQRNALRVLATTPEPNRVSAVLREQFDREGGPPRDATLSALAHIGGPENDALIARSLDPTDSDLLEVALRALAESRSLRAADEVRVLLADTKVAARFLGPLIAYFTACPEVVEDEVCDDFFSVVVREDFKQDVTTRVIGFLMDHHDEWSRELERGLETLALRPDDVGFEARLALAISGDRSAKRELLEPFDQAIDDTPEAARAWAQRAHVNFRMRDYKEAARDYEEALKADRQSALDRRNEWYEELARAYARMGKLREVGQTLEQSSLSTDRIRDLADDPDFAEVAAHSRYGKVFRAE